MRMYLSSFRLGEHPEHLRGLIDRAGPVAVIANAADGAPAEVRAAAVQFELDALDGIGLAAVEIDLRDHTDDAAGLTERLERHPTLWVRGGNVFVLRAAMARSGADRAITDLVRRDRLVYAGYSAGPCVAGPHLRGLETVDDISQVQSTYGCEPVWEGLGLLEHPFVPHVDSPGHPETGDCTRLAERWDREGVTHHALRDGQALVIRGEEERIV
jgi:dipeptidase E